MSRRKIDVVKITGNIGLTVAASLLYLYHHQPSTCENIAGVFIAVGANLWGLLQNPPTNKPTPEDLLDKGWDK